MGKKYIIEVEDGKEGIIFCQTGIVTVGLHLDDESSLRPLGIQSAIPYTEPDLDAIRNEEYEKGVQDTKQHWVDAPRSCAYKLGYESGLNAAWEAAKKIGSNSMCSLKEMGFDFSQCVVSDYNPSWFVVKNYSAAEAIEKIQQYEQEKEEIKVGDVVEAPFGAAIVTYVEGDRVEFFHDSGVYGWDKKENITKTGKFFPEIAEVLKKLREAE